MIKGVIFDFDGTLFDSMEIWNHIASDYLKTKGIEDLSITKTVSNMSMQEALLYIQNTYHIKDDISIMNQDVHKLLYNYYAYETKPKEGIVYFLKYLKSHHIKMFILSASTRQLIKVALKHYCMEQYFDEIMCCDELNLDKNSPDIFMKTLQRMNLNVDEVVVIEDAYHAIVTAKEMGLKVIGIYDKSEKRDIQSLVDFYIYDYTEMEDYINEESINNCRN